MLKGVLEGYVLEIVSRGETYSYEITLQLRELGFTDVVECTVYTITMRLEKNKFVDIEKSHPRWAHRANFIGSMKLASKNWQISGQKELYLKQTKRIKSKIKRINMSIFAKIFGYFSKKKAWREMENRAKALPKDYYNAYKAMQKYLWNSGGVMDWQ